jgi:hypothetical protein
MFLIYHPEGSEEPTKFNYQPKKLMSAEREMLEKLSGLTYEKFYSALIEGSSVCRRALLFIFLKRNAPKTRYEDVDFAWGEVELQFSRQELLEFKKGLESLPPSDEKSAGLAQIEEMLADAEDADESGKAPSSN